MHAFSSPVASQEHCSSSWRRVSLRAILNSFAGDNVQDLRSKRVPKAKQHAP